MPTAHTHLHTHTHKHYIYPTCTARDVETPAPSLPVRRRSTPRPPAAVLCRLWHHGGAAAAVVAALKTDREDSCSSGGTYVTLRHQYLLRGRPSQQKSSTAVCVRYTLRAPSSPQKNTSLSTHTLVKQTAVFLGLIKNLIFIDPPTARKGRLRFVRQ